MTWSKRYKPNAFFVYDLLVLFFLSTAINRNKKQKITGSPITQMSLANQIMNWLSSIPEIKLGAGNNKDIAKTNTNIRGSQYLNFCLSI